MITESLRSIDLVNRPFIPIALLRTLYFYDTITPVNHFLPAVCCAELSIPTSWCDVICQPRAKIFGKLLAKKLAEIDSIY